MSLSLNVGYTDSALDPDVAQDLSMAKLNFADYAVKVDTAGNCVITNITSPMDRPERFRFGYKEINDVYKGSGIDPGYYGASRKGFSLVTQNTNVLRIDDSADSSNIVDLPISIHLVVKAPAHQLVTASVIYTMLGRMLAVIHEQAGSDSTKLALLVRGSLKPSEL